MKVKVIRSYNNDDESVCVDIFLRSDGTWGFEQYRRDFEEGSWFPISDYRARIYLNESAAFYQAKKEIPWFNSSYD